MQPLLLLARQSHGSLASLCDELCRRNIPFYRFATSQYPSEIVSSLRISQEREEISWFSKEHTRIPLEDSKVIFFQDYDQPSREVIYDRTIMKYLQEEGDAFLQSMYWGLASRYWVNDPFASARAENKPQQLALAARRGLRIPATLVTNSLTEATTFFQTFPKGCVIKPLKCNRIEDTSGIKVMMTRRISDTFPLETIRSGPCFFQEYIPKSLELRVFVIGEEVLATAISAPQEIVDWRTAVSTIKVEPYTLDPTLALQCKEITQEMGLHYAALDLALDQQGYPVFFEINPTGEWAWFECRTGAPLSSTLVDHLLAHNL